MKTITQIIRVCAFNYADDGSIKETIAWDDLWFPSKKEALIFVANHLGMYDVFQLKGLNEELLISGSDWL